MGHWLASTFDMMMSQLTRQAINQANEQGASCRPVYHHYMTGGAQAPPLPCVLCSVELSGQSPMN